MIVAPRHPTGRFHQLAQGIGFAVGLSILPLGAQPQAYDGPIFAKGLWRFERSLEVSSRNAEMPRSKHVRVDPAVTRCVDPTEAMKETFRSATIGQCQSTAPEKGKNTYRFAKRCDHLGPVITTITIESPTAYREINETLAGASKKETVVARRLGDCGFVADRGAPPTPLDLNDPSSYYPPLPDKR
jgi:hypothetical protein